MSQPIFSASEIERRQRVITDRLRADCVVIPSFHNSYYASGFPMRQFGRYSITILFRDSDPVIIAPTFEAAGIATNSPIEDVRYYLDDGSPIEVTSKLIAGILRERQVRAVGIEAEGMSAAMVARLRDALPRAEFIDESASIDITRLASSEEELAYLRKAVEIGDVGMGALLDAMRPGADETRLAAVAVAAMVARAVPGLDVHGNCYMQQNERSAECHASALAIPIGDEGFVEVYVECEVWHYQCSIERPVLLPFRSEELERATLVAREALFAARDALGPGIEYHAVDAASRKVLINAGYPEVMSGAGIVRNIIHHTGGRIPQGELRFYNRRTLEPGTSITIEPWALIPSGGSPRYCDPVAVTDTGWERLGTTTDDLIELSASAVH
jgi:Xaa-Pro dipeptidase